MTKMEKGKRYNIQPIKGEDYSDCEFGFGIYLIKTVDEQYFQTFGKETWWDSEGFKVVEVPVGKRH